jgi:hypothetical protein
MIIFVNVFWINFLFFNKKKKNSQSLKHLKKEMEVRCWIKMEKKGPDS